MTTVTADSYGIDNTGATDVTAALATAINAQPAGTLFQLHANGRYKSDSVKVWNNANGITVDGQNATIFESTRRVGVVLGPAGTVKTLQITGANMVVRNLNMYGFRKDVYTGQYLVAVNGAPTVAGTTMVLDAQNEEVRLPQIVYDTIAGQKNYETAYYSRDPDGFIRFEFSASDTAQVTSDAVFSIINDANGAVLFSQAFTLTSSPATYAISWNLPLANLGTQLRITVKKATATPNTITLASITPYGEGNYRSSSWAGDAKNPPYSGGDEFTHHFYPIGTGVLIENCWSEGTDGDGFNLTQAGADTTILNCTSRCSNRQGLTLENSVRSIVDGYTGREARRSGIDIEPNDVTMHVVDATIRNCTLINCRNYAIGCGHPPQVTNLNISDIVSFNIGMGPMAGGATGGTISNWVHTGTYRLDADRVLNGGLTNADCPLYWQGLECDNFTTDIGFALQNKGSAFYRDMHVRGAVVTNPRPPSYRTFLDTMGTALTGQAWRDEVGAWNIDNGKAYNAFQIANGVSSIETGMSNVIVEADATFPPGSSNGGLVLRVLDGLNFILMQIVANTNTMNIYTKVAGVFTLLGTLTIPSVTNSTVHLKAVANGSTMQFYTAGVLRTTVVNSTNLTNTRCGLDSSNMTLLFDNFSVVAA